MFELEVFHFEGSKFYIPKGKEKVDPYYFDFDCNIPRHLQLVRTLHKGNMSHVEL